MKTKSIFGLFLILAFAVFVSPAFAAAGNEEIVNNEDLPFIGLGTVARIEANKLVLMEYEYETDVEQEVVYEITDKTEYESVKSASDLKIGDSVEVVYGESNGKKTALSISKEENYIEDEDIKGNTEGNEAVSEIEDVDPAGQDEIIVADKVTKFSGNQM